MRFSPSLLAFAGTITAVLLGNGPVLADTLIYANDPTNIAPAPYDQVFNTIADIGQTGGFVTDSFTVTSSATLTKAQLYIWQLPEYPVPHTQIPLPTTLTWALGATPFSSGLGTGTAALTSSELLEDSNNDVLSQSSFALTKNLAAGTYYLTLSNSSSTLTTENYWDVSNLPVSSAFFNNTGNSLGTSQAFEIYGNVNPPPPTPEPGSVALLGSLGLTAAAFLHRRRTRT